MRRLLGFSVVVVFMMLTAAVVVAELPPGGTFVDDNGNFHEPNIEAIAAAGITQGCNPPTNDRYCPDDLVTRAEMAAFLLRGIGEAGSLPTYQGYFSDVPAGLWYTGYAERLFELGITTGCALEPLRYCPNGSVTRAEMAAFILRAIGEDQNLPVYQGYFSDVPAGLWYTGYAERLFELGITTGCETGKYCPNDPVKRDQMASFLTRALGLAPIVPPAPLQTTTTTAATPTSFGSGTWRVGSDIQPGTYRNSDSSGMCYAARLSGFGGTLDEIIANELSSSIMIVTIEPSDAGFQSEDCGVWSNQLTPCTNAPTSSFGDGYYLIGTEVAAGLWRNSDSSQMCYWERLSGFGWSLQDIITNKLSTSIQTVQVKASDLGFHSEDCGVWTYLGP